MAGQLTEIFGIPANADLAGFGASLNGVVGIVRMYYGVAIDDPSLAIFVVCWESRAANEAYNANESTKEFIRTFSESLEAHPEKEKIFHSYLESSDHPADIFTSPVTEVALCTVKPDADAKQFEELFGTYNKEKNQNGDLGSWGKDTRHQQRYVITVARQSEEETKTASAAAIETPSGQVMSNMMEKYEFKHVSFGIVEKPDM